MGKKGQIQGQPFIYIFIIIVSVLIITFGVKVLLDVINLGCKVEISTMIDKIEKSIESCYDLDKGSTCYFEDVSVCSDLTELCFINLDESVNVNAVKDDITRVIINNSVTFQEGFNLFLVPKEGKQLDKRKFKIRFTKVDENPLCEDLTDGKLNLILYNDGNNVRIRRE
ncbi:hypothetical protein J4455_04240 [Candidatus Woesearchaeota archaeon]|nr:hypothetical protein [Candidatus Woesearchaeota archaeon]